MFDVYSIPVSLYCAKLRILLRHKGLDWREIPPPGGYGSDEYKTIVPSGNLPALRDGDFLIADSEAIAEYLNEKHPEPPMLPADLESRAKARERSRFHDTRLEPEVRTLFPFLRSDNHLNTAIRNAQSEAISKRLGQFDRMLMESDPLIDDRLTLGDCGFPVTFTWIDLLTPIFGLAIDWPQGVRAYHDRIADHPTVALELADYRPKIEAFLAKGTG